MKSKVKVERAERCDCLNPELIEQIAMGNTVNSHSAPNATENAD